MTHTLKRLFALILAAMMVVVLLPVSADAADNEVLAQVITMSDYQNSSLSSSAKKTVPQAIVKSMVAANVNPELALIGGDYTDGSVGADGDDTSQANLETELGNLTGILTSAWSGLPYYAIQGNHDYSGFVNGSTLNYDGAYEKDDYIVYLINEDSFPWWQGNYGSGSSTAQDKATVTATTNALSTYLNNLIDNGDTRPVIIMTHVPIHWSVRSANRNWYYDNIYANILFEAVNKAAEDLDILFLFGHNHSSTGEGDGLGYDNEIGDALAYVAKGESMKVPNGTDGSANYTTETLNFTYMNAGYVGKYNGSTSDCSISTLNICSDSIVINRYTYNGTVYTKTIDLENTAPRVTVVDNVTGVSLSLPSENAMTVKTVTVNALEDESLYTNYVAYDISLGTALADSEVARVTLPADGFTTRAKVYEISYNGTLTEMDASVSNGTVNFSTSSLGTYAIAELNLPYVEIPVVGTVESGKFYHITDELEDGNIYLLVSNDSYLKAIQDTGTAYTQSSWDYETTISTQSMTSQTDSNGEYIQGPNDSLLWEAVAGDIDGYYYLKNVATGAYLQAGYDVDTTYGRNINTTSNKSDNYINFKAVSSSGIGIYAVQNSSNLSTYRWVRYSNSDQWFQGRTSYQSGAVQLWLENETEPEETTVGVSMEKLSGSVAQNSSSSASTGAKLILTYANGSTESVDVTLDMLTDAKGNSISTADFGTLTGLTVTYLDTVITTNFTLDITEVYKDWVALPGGYVYTLDTDGIDIGEDNTYLIVGSSNNYALTLSGNTIGAAAVSIDNNTITLEDPSNCAFYFADNSNNESGTYLLTQNGSQSVYHSGGNMYYGSDNKGYWYINSSSNGAYKVYDYDNMNWYLNYGYVWGTQSVSRFAVSSTSRTVRLFKRSGSSISADYIRLGGETIQNYTTADAATLDTVLGKVMIQTSDDGINMGSEEITVTSEMVTWDITFDGKAPGTYVGAVVYEEQTMGTITVTITSEHNFETVTIEATCTEAGSVTTRCTICGEETVEVIPATGHSYECTETAATCSEDGKKVYICSICDHSYSEAIPATGDHSYECTETAATCGAEGKKLYTCAVCFNSYTEVIPATGDHSYTTETVNATCTETGSVTGTCSVCGHVTSEVIAAAGHSYSSTVTAPTCTDAGFTTYACDTCGHSYIGDETAALGHSYDSVVTATCTVDGCVVYTCSVCGHSYNGETVAAYGHSYESTVVAPTCATAGYTTHVCITCGDTYTDSEAAALGHSYTEAVTAPTCTEGGFTTYTCTTCGHSYTGSEVAALGHDYDSVVTEPTFETEGFTTHTCRICGDVTVDSYVPVLSHDYETVTVEATCTVDGSVTHTCVTCGYTYTEVLTAPGHSFETSTTEADCVNNGAITRTCTTCGHVESETIPATGHSYETTRIEPSCTAAGYITYTCACGDVVTEEIPAAGHSYESVYANPTCTETGGTTYTCTACGHSYTDAVAALGHSYEAVSVAPTCTQAGYTTYTCATCGDSYTADETAALGHSYNETVTEPTCTAAGYTTFTCTVCGDSYTAGETAALGHSYSCTESDGYLVYTCGNCGESYSEKIETVSYTKVTSLSSDNNYVITLYSGNKYYALSHEDNEISVTQVTVSGSEITSEITEDLIWTYSNKKLSYEDNGTTYYLYAKSSSGWWGWMSTPTLTLSTSSSSTVSFSSSKLKVGSYYLRYSSSSVSLNRSATTTYLFIEE